MSALDGNADRETGTVPDACGRVVRNRAVYRRESLRAGREEWMIYVLDSFTAVQAVGKLVRGYRPRDADLD